jgi:uncharacterized protein YjiS (DUF1127 family)
MQYQGSFSRVGSSKRSRSIVHDLAAEARRLLITACGLFLLWQTRKQQRRRLIEMSDTQLSDIGVGRSEALREGSKPFWRH